MTKKTTFEDAIGQLESLVKQMEQGQLPLAESLAAYEEGIHLIKHCHGLLKEGEAKIIKLTGSDETGRPRLEPFLIDANEGK
ncbi:MAG TPA: exodeoxyribonuclease VII small subunit [Gemmatales bacterium]|nr:exodeoxyribonuclease VII small subunit [Gemmatales bacterium]